MNTATMQPANAPVWRRLLRAALALPPAYAGLLVLLLLAVVAAALVQLRSMRASMEVITGNAMPSVEVINQIGTDVVRTRLLEVRHVNNDDAADKTDSEKQLEQLQRRLAERRKAYEPLLSSDEERRLYAQLVQ